MSNIILSKPAANQASVVKADKDSNFVLQFSTEDTQLSKSENGENLVITFADGAKVEIEGFYTAFNVDHLPVFSINGQEVSGSQLTALLGEDLLPAAGVASPASSGGSNANFAESALNGGISRLSGLDVSGGEGLAAPAQQVATTSLYTSVAGEAQTISPSEPTSPQGYSDSDPSPSQPITPSGGGSTPAGGGTTPGGDTPPVTPPAVENLKVADDFHKTGILNTTSINVLDNDKGGLVAADTVLTFSHNSKYGNVEATAAGDVTLTLDGKQLENALYEGTGVDKILANPVNNAGKLNILTDGVEMTYTAQGGEHKGTANAVISVGDNDLVMTGGSGNDVAWVAGNSGTIETGDGTDTIVAANNTGNINAGDGADKLYIGQNDSTVDGGAGADTINISKTNAGEIQGGAGSDTITIYENAGTVYGGAGADNVDIVQGKAGNYVSGGEGQDTLVLRGGSSYMEGGDDGDSLKVQGDDDVHMWTSNWGDAESKARSLQKAEEMDAQYATLVGGAGNDTLKASDVSHHNVLYGDDTNPGSSDVVGSDQIQIFDYSHDNTAYGGGGEDSFQIFRHAHHNKVYGGDDAAIDKLTVQDNAHHNTLHGGAGNDSLIAKGQGGTFIDTNVNSIAWGKADFNKLYGDAGDDTLQAISGAQNNLLDGGTGNDSLIVNGNSESRTQGSFVSEYYETTGNTLKGGEGTDTLRARGDAVKNMLYGGEGEDELYAQGTSTGNKLYGEEGNDHMWAQTNATGNELYGGDGDDIMKAQGSATGNTLNGEEGNDKLYAQDLSNGNTLNGGEGGDYLYAQGNSKSNELNGDGGSDVLFAESYSECNTLNGGSDNDSLAVKGNALFNLLNGGSGDDSLTVEYNAHNNTLHGDEDNDAFYVTGGMSNSMYGDEGNDFFDLTSNSSGIYSNTYDGGSGLDIMLAPDGAYLDGVFATLSNTEAVVTQGADRFANMSHNQLKAALADLGVDWGGKNEDKFDFEESAGWSMGEVKNYNGNDYFEMNNSHEDMSILVAKASLEFTQS